MSSADFKRDLLQFGGINATNGTIFLKGNIRMLGNGSAMPQLTVGNLTVTGNAVIPGISFASLSVAGNITSGQFFIGNGALLSGVTSTLPTAANLDIIGNVTAPGNVSVAGQVNALGNIVAPFFIGNGSQLTGLASTSLPAVANLDIRGNVIGAYANVTNIIAASGNVGTLAGGNIAVSGQVNALGNVVAPFFIGNGSQLSGLLTSLPAVANIDIRGNVIGAYANVTNIIAASGNVGNVLLAGGNIAASGQVNALGNVVAPFF
ncbi:Chlorovirus glycoprotein repeat domain-containing protein, partial [Paramecium bursaria Chlorella virus OR0704.2.2]